MLRALFAGRRSNGCCGKGRCDAVGGPGEVKPGMVTLTLIIAHANQRCTTVRTGHFAPFAVPCLPMPVCLPPDNNLCAVNRQSSTPTKHLIQYISTTQPRHTKPPHSIDHTQPHAVETVFRHTCSSYLVDPTSARASGPFPVFWSPGRPSKCSFPRFPCSGMHRLCRNRTSLQVWFPHDKESLSRMRPCQARTRASWPPRDSMKGRRLHLNKTIGRVGAFLRPGQGLTAGTPSQPSPTKISTCAVGWARRRVRTFTFRYTS